MGNYVHEAREDLQQRLTNLPDELADLYTLLALVKGDAVTLEDVHDAWSVWKDRIDPAHRSLIPFKDLTHEVQELDRAYRDAIVVTGKKYAVREHENIEKLRQSARELAELEAQGVDNWDGYGQAMRRAHGEEDEY